ncbi:hypothetical protein L5515_018269 [Caenorhabditis briggsae]|uniref:EGF-like domain-containing protein n=1 Tax=Caenorhabditis briggsae TaxID=6238 RepID=A0AAE9FIX8_CAEBR|nr:hypothetical protein L5515_018269 [Caenorhabditis briggsae]
MMIREKMCVQRKKVNIGRSCSLEDQCLGNSTCTDNSCQCPPGHAASLNVCVLRKTVTPGYLCNPEDICTGQSVCIKGVCQCQPDYKQMHNICVKKNIGVEGSPCSNRDDCGEGLTCSSGKCSCPEGLFSVNGRCRSYVQMGHTCTSDDRCTDRNALCQENVCSCKSGFTNITGQCSANIVQPAEPETLSQVKSTKCLASNQCPSGAQCVKGECKCKPGLAISRYGFCVPITFAEPGTSCAYGERCQKDSHCADGLCTCNEPLILKENKCVKSPREQAARRTQQPRTLTECPRDGSCKLPDCFCTSTGKMPPDNLDPKQVPQMVLLSFDDPITDRIINTLKSLFSGKIRNPNGCAIKGTFFVSHQWNNYDQTLWLHSKGNEIGVNSITKEDLSGRTKERWYKEQKGMRETLAEFSYVDRSQILGTRAPMFKVGGDAQYEMITENNFTYDNSMLVSGAYWPQTLDHKLPWDCTEKCPTQTHKGIWEIPIQNLQGDDSRWYKTLNRALKPVDSRDSVKKMLMRNFMNHYKTNRAPFVLTLDTEFLTYLPDNGAIYALEDFLKDIVLKQDVFIVTGSQMIDWMRSPYDLNNIKNLRSWQCKFLVNDHVQPCEVPSTCSFDGRSRGLHAHSFRMCGVCPTSYPWIS